MIKIKVSDLLRNPGSEDKLKLENIKSDMILWLTWDLINCDIKIQSINDNTVIVVIKNLKAYINSISDISNETFVRKVFCEKYEAKFGLSFDPNSELEFEEDFAIDNSWNIDIEEMLYDAVMLQTPSVIMTDDELARLWNVDVDTDDE